MASTAGWDRYTKHLCVVDTLGLSLDVSKMRFSDAWLAAMQAPLAKAFDEMAALEQGAIANPDEQRRVGHYWLRAPELAPAAEAEAIRAALGQVKAFTRAVHDGTSVRGDYPVPGVEVDTMGVDNPPRRSAIRGAT
jgi:glucose-6-phosphate isomerase